MKAIKILIFLFVITSCNKDDFIHVSSLDQIQGLWEWESTCGGIIATCGYPSDSNYQSIEFTDDYQFIEKHNGAIYSSSTYVISKNNPIEGNLIIIKTGTSDTLSNRPISLMNNRLMLDAGEILKTYKKIK